MDKRKRKRLESKGWTVGSTAEFLGLSPKEATVVEIRLALGWKNDRKRRRMTSRRRSNAYRRRQRSG